MFLYFLLLLVAIPASVYGEESVISLEVYSRYTDGGQLASFGNCPTDSQYEVDLSGQRTVRVLVDMESMRNSTVSFYVGLLRPTIKREPWKPIKKENGFYVLHDPGERQIIEVYGTVPEGGNFSLLDLKKDGLPLVGLRGITKAASIAPKSLESRPFEETFKNTILPQAAVQFYKQEFERARLIMDTDLASKQADVILKELQNEEVKARTAHLKIMELEGDLKNIEEKQTNNAKRAQQKLVQAKEAYNLRLYDEQNFQGDALDYANEGLRILHPSLLEKLKTPLFPLLGLGVICFVIIMLKRRRQAGI
jgi:hypothetical protein